MDKLEELLARGPDPARGLRGLVLARYTQITQARHQLWQWGEIAEALDLPPTSGPSLGEAYRRVAKRVAAGTLEPPPPTTPAPAARRPMTRETAISPGAAKNEPATTGAAPDKTPGQKHKNFTNIPLD